MIAQLSHLGRETFERPTFLLPLCAALAIASGCESSVNEGSGDPEKRGQKTAVSGKVHSFTDANFSKEVLQEKGPVLVDFWAAWCGPCKRLAPIIKQLASDYEGKVKVGKLNTDHNKRTAATYGIRGIPDVRIFKNGKVVGRIRGLNTKNAYQDLVNKHLQSQR